MARDLVAHNKPVFDQIHPNIYGAAAMRHRLLPECSSVYFFTTL